MSDKIDRSVPWISRSITEATKNADFKKVMDITVERVAMGRQVLIISWALFGISALAFIVSAVGWIIILTRPPPESDVWIDNRDTGLIARPVPMSAAVLTFGGAEEEHYLRQYINARRAWTPDQDVLNDHVAKIMSAPSEQAAINRERAQATSDPVAVGKGGHVMLERFRWHPQAMDKGSQTRRYLVLVDRTVWHGDKPEQTEPWSITIDFQWHPDYLMNPDDRAWNPGGFQAVGFSATPDRPDPIRRR